MKKTNFEKFMTQVLRGKQLQRYSDYLWEDCLPDSMSLGRIHDLYNSNLLRLKPTAAINLKKKIVKLEKELNNINQG